MNAIADGREFYRTCPIPIVMANSAVVNCINLLFFFVFAVITTGSSTVDGIRVLTGIEAIVG